MSRRRFALSISVLSAVALAAASFIEIAVLFPWGIPTLASVVVAGLLTWRVPSNVVAWLLLAFASTASIGVLLLAVARAVDDPALAGWCDVIGNAINTAGVMALPAALLRFPDGLALSRRWKYLEWVVVVAAVLGGSAAFINGGWGGDVDQGIGTAPLRAATAPLGDILSSIFYALMLVSMSLATIDLLLRYLKSRGEERLKIKWLAYSGGFVLCAFLAIIAAGGWNVALDDDWQAVLVALAFASIPAAIAIAVLQYRLYDIDIVISRTVVLAVMAAFITSVYAVVVVGIGQLIGGDSENLLLPIVATGVVALAFEPVRHRAQRWANRLVYGRRASPYEVLSDLTTQLSGGEEGEGILDRMAARIGDGTGATRATVWLSRDDGYEPAASWPVDETSEWPVNLAAPHVFPVVLDEEVVGALEVVKPRGTALSSAERALMVDLAGSAGAVLAYQRLNDSLADKARELAESRARLVEAQDQERRRLERDLHDGAQQLIVALKVKIGLARALAAKSDARDLEKLLADLSEEAQAALDEVRSLAKGIYPPVLESDGLGAAVSGLAAGAPVDIVVSKKGIGRYPADVEAAIYFDISEAVTNAVKHADPPIRIDLSEEEGVVRFVVSDDGPGFDVATTPAGSGLANMEDRLDALGGRLTISSGPGEGTVVRGEVPLAPALV